MKMTTNSFIMSVLLSVFIVAASQAQSSKTLYFEALGNGVVYSINYDWRFKPGSDGIGARIGFGGIYAQKDVVITLPVMVNYLIGKNGHFLELGAGGGFYRFPDNIVGDYDWEAVVGATFSVKYRWQSPKGGLMFTVGWTPLFSNELTHPYWMGISFGHAFKPK